MRQTEIQFNQFDFEQHLRFHFGNVDAMRESFTAQLNRYQSVANKTAAVCNRINEYERMIKLCNPKQETQ